MHFILLHWNYNLNVNIFALALPGMMEGVCGKFYDGRSLRLSPTPEENCLCQLKLAPPLSNLCLFTPMSVLGKDPKILGDKSLANDLYLISDMMN